MKRHFPFCILAALFIGQAERAAAAPAESVELDPIVVVASKSPRPLSEVAGQVSVIDAEFIDRYVLQGLDELLRYEPGLTAETDGTRFGVSRVNIRGIGGNRVAIEVDGVPVRNGFAIGSYSNGGQNLVETALVERVEVLHGPASSLYGSDALAGVMAITTWDPDDLVARGNGEHWFSLGGDWRGSDRSTSLEAIGAWAADQHGLMLSAVRREGHETEFVNPAGLADDPQNWRSRNAFIRYHFDTPAANRLRLTVERYERERLTELRSILGYARFASTTALEGDDRDDVSRVLLDYNYSSPAWEQGVLRLFSSRSDTHQLTREERATARVPSRFEREFRYDTEVQGLEWNAFRTFASRRAEHRLGLGIELLRTRTEEWRGGFQQKLADGSVSHTVLGEALPVRDFPNARVTETAVFLQDEISLGAWDIVPAVRWDAYRLSPRPDAIYLDDYPDVDIVGSSESQFTPRLGVIRELGAEWSVYGQYMQGFRAPPHEDVNIGLDISLFRFRALPNPDLSPETSSGYEFGIRQFTAKRRFSLALFETRYEDFIESRVPVGVDPASGYLLFQSRNISRARIRGADLRLEQDLDAWWPGWRLHAALYWSEGDRLDTGQPLNSVSPPQAVLGLSWDAADGRWYASLTGTFTRPQQRIDHSDQARFAPPGWAVFDLAAGWRPAPGLSMAVSLRNLADRHYWRWSDISRLAPGDPMRPLLARPGRHASLSLRFDW